MDSPTVVSLFSGAGGLDFGFKQAGFDIVWACEKMEVACKTYRINFPETRLFEGDIREITSSYFITFNRHLDVMIGGYPCQGFSIAGARSPTDSRNLLYKEFCRMLQLLTPKVFLAENVPGLLSMPGIIDAMIDAFENAGYQVQYRVLNSADYGVPQLRKRVFIVGVRDDLGEEFLFPEPTHARNPGGGEGLKPWISIQDFLDGVPEPAPADIYSGEYTSRFMSRQRKRQDLPSYTIVAQAKQIPLHPAGEKMMKVDRDLWKFVGSENRRLSTEECKLLQSFPASFIISGNLEERYKQIGNAVPPLVAYHLATAIHSIL